MIAGNNFLFLAETPTNGRRALEHWGIVVQRNRLSRSSRDGSRYATERPVRSHEEKEEEENWKWRKKSEKKILQGQEWSSPFRLRGLRLAQWHTWTRRQNARGRRGDLEIDRDRPYPSVAGDAPVYVRLCSVNSISAGAEP